MEISLSSIQRYEQLKYNGNLKAFFRAVSDNQYDCENALKANTWLNQKQEYGRIKCVKALCSRAHVISPFRI